MTSKLMALLDFPINSSSVVVVVAAAAVDIETGTDIDIVVVVADCNSHSFFDLIVDGMTFD